MKKYLSFRYAFFVSTLIFVFFALWTCLPYGYVPEGVGIFRVNQRVGTFYNLCLYGLKRIKDPAFCYDIIESSDVKVDVVIPVIDKDAPVVVKTIESIRKFVMHPIGNIYLVAPESSLLHQLAKEHHCIFIDEKVLLEKYPLIKKQGGWIIQQFIKLMGDQIAQEDHYLVVDADTVFIRPQVFVNKNHKYIFNVHWNYTLERKNFTKKALNINRQYRLDFVPHHMLFSKKILGEMKRRLENLHSNPDWVEALGKLSQEDKTRGLSEYDLYTTFAVSEHPKDVLFVASSNITVPRDLLNELEAITPALAGDYKTVSLHDFILSKKSGK